LENSNVSQQDAIFGHQWILPSQRAGDDRRRKQLCDQKDHLKYGFWPLNNLLFFLRIKGKELKLPFFICRIPELLKMSIVFQMGQALDRSLKF
jgi:hypothetical protein